jgi:hypothetical protein
VPLTSMRLCLPGCDADQASRHTDHHATSLDRIRAEQNRARLPATHHYLADPMIADYRMTTARFNARRYTDDRRPEGTPHVRASATLGSRQKLRLASPRNSGATGWSIASSVIRVEGGGLQWGRCARDGAKPLGQRLV